MAENIGSKGFLEEEKGQKSAMRAMSFIALIASIVFGYMSIGKNAGDAGVIITFSFLLAAFAPKTLQKFAEDKIDNANK